MKNTKYTKKKQETNDPLSREKQSIKPDSEMIQMLELSQEDFKITKSNML